MSNLSGFNASNVEPAQDFEAMPAGEYVACITDSEMKATSSGDGSYLSLTLEILEGEYSNRKVWNNLNLDNPNARAVQISERVLSSICHACAENSGDNSLLTPLDSKDLHDIPMIIKLSLEEYNGSFRNEVKSYKTYGGKAPAQPKKPATPTPLSQQPASQQAEMVQQGVQGSQAVGSSSAPWNRK